MKSKKQKFKEMNKTLRKHHEGKLNKGNYAPDGHLYGKALFSGMSQTEAMKVAKKREEKEKDKVNAKKQALKKRLDYLAEHPELKEKEVIKVDPSKK